MSRTPQPTSSAVSVSDLVKSFPKKRAIGQLFQWGKAREQVEALRGVSFEIARGELVGLLGPNGAGKTTLIKILCGLVLPDKGRASILGVPSERHERSRLLGLVHGEERSFYWRLTARENLHFFGRLHGLAAGSLRRRVDLLLERVELTSEADRRFGDFSSGMRQRLAIARALLADPPVLLMDEPTRSLDPVSAAHLRQWIVRELHEQDGKTIVLATHNLREAEMLCDRVAVLAHGRLVAIASPESLRRAGAGGLVYRLKLGQGELPTQPRQFELLEQADDGEGLRVVVRIESEARFEPMLAELREAGIVLLACAPHEEDLELVFHRLVDSAKPA